MSHGKDVMYKWIRKYHSIFKPVNTQSVHSKDLPNRIVGKTAHTLIIDDIEDDLTVPVVVLSAEPTIK